MVVIVSGVGGNELYVLYGQGGSELPSVTPLVTIAISMYFMIFCFKGDLKNNPHERSSHEGG